MDLDLNKCPKCGNVADGMPDVCPQCGEDLAAHRARIYAEIMRLKKVEEDQKADPAYESSYKNALELYSKGLFRDAILAFLTLGNYKDSAEYVEKVRDAYYHRTVVLFMTNEGLASMISSSDKDAKEEEEEEKVVDLKSALLSMSESEYVKLREDFEYLATSRNTAPYIACCNQAIETLKYYKEAEAYERAMLLYQKKEYPAAKTIFDALTRIPDAVQYAKLCNRAITSAQKRKDYVRKSEIILQIIAFLSPFVMAIVFGIILFCNKKQLTLIGSYAGLVTGWVFFSLAAIVIAIVFFNYRTSLGPYVARRVSASIIGLVTLITSIVVIAEASTLVTPFTPHNILSVSIVGKVDDINYDCTEFTFELDNKLDYKLNGAFGEMRLYENGKQIAVYDVTFNGNYQPGINRITIRVNNPRADVFNAELEDMSATFSITQISSEADVVEFDGSDLQTVAIIPYG